MSVAMLYGSLYTKSRKTSAIHRIIQDPIPLILYSSEPRWAWCACGLRVFLLCEVLCAEQSRFAWKQSRLAWKPSRLAWNFSSSRSPLRGEISPHLGAISPRLQAISPHLEAISSRLEFSSLRTPLRGAISPRLEAISSRLQAISPRLEFLFFTKSPTRSNLVSPGSDLASAASHLASPGISLLREVPCVEPSRLAWNFSSLQSPLREAISPRLEAISLRLEFLFFAKSPARSNLASPGSHLVPPGISLLQINLVRVSR
ncbi:hypothetical protein ACLB2K_029061 [Fragaria x ananassa]